MTPFTHLTNTMPTIFSQRLLQVCDDGTFHNFSLLFNLKMFTKNSLL